MPHHANLRCRTGLIVSRLCGSTLRSRTTLRRHDLPTSSSACSLQTQQCIFRPNVDVVRGYATNQEKKVPLLKKTSPYWHLFETRAKRRWQGRSLLDVLSTEFRERSMDYYRYAVDSRLVLINGQVAKPGATIRNDDRIDCMVHRHEPPITSTPVRVLHHDRVHGFIVVDKPSSIPVHPTGRYFRTSLIEILKHDFGFENVHAVNRLDRLTSGIMIIPLITPLAKTLYNEFANGTVQKEYIARCKGNFPSGEITCNSPLLAIDRQMALNIVHHEGKPSLTIFKRLRYDPSTDTSIVHCRPMTGRSHQIRVHLQYLGHPVANDPIYSEARIWASFKSSGKRLGKGGVETIPNTEQCALSHPRESRSDAATDPELLSRRYDDIGLASPVPLSAELIRIIQRLRDLKDEEENWSRLRDTAFLSGRPPAVGDDAASYCPECFFPLRPDPKHARLRIFLHALRYTTSLGTFETEMPGWATERWTWDAEHSGDDVSIVT
ncbi:hypothetical protein FOMPIDRAFT_1124040 [Fomitopsis schrenkii]|uniref:Pseudouridine synthase n=1 Tax=Fomitopsis schrenkii TaxID=2126942 RepID=S8E489_FOMSC|nr:hypothetical protein FOMPIDRAFT_1124040 [Fomitopsis schrenkii]